MDFAYEVGDVVKVRDWDDMAAEFGEDGDRIMTPRLGFIPKMKKYCGDNSKITRLIYDYGIPAYLLDIDENKLFKFTEDMFIPSTQISVTFDEILELFNAWQ